MNTCDLKVGMVVLINTKAGLYTEASEEIGIICSTEHKDYPRALCWNKEAKTFGSKTVSHHYKNSYKLLDEKKSNWYRLLLNRFAKMNLDELGLTTGWQIGSDPEIFAVDENDIVIPAFSFLPNKKNRTHDNGVFWDGFQAEFNPKESSCYGWLMDRIQAGLKEVYEKAVSFNPKARLTYKSVVDVPFEMMASVSDKHASLGCSPSLNAYNDVEPLMIENPRGLSCRFAGCHIHFGMGSLTRIQVDPIVKFLDAFLGVISVSMFQGMEDPRRRKFYGKAGEYRLPSHGLEYRVPSSALLCHPSVTNLAFDLARAGAKLAYQGITRVWKASEDEVRDIVDNYNIDQAKEVIKRNKPFLARVIRNIYSDESTVRIHRNALLMINEGVKNLLPVEDVVGNWDLCGSWVTHCDGKNRNMTKLKAL